jgi:hypothetical protein
MKIYFEQDFIDRLSKGDCIPPSEVARLAGITETDQDSVNFAALKVAGLLEKVLWKNGKHWSLRVVNGSVYVLSDAESVEFQAKRFRTGVKKIRRSKKHVERVDVSQLGEIEKRRHEIESRKISVSLDSLQRSLRDVNKATRPTQSERVSPPPPIKPAGFFGRQSGR